MCFLGDGMGFQGQSQPKFQNFNIWMWMRFSVALRFFVGYSSHQFPWHPPFPCQNQWVHARNIFLKLCYFLKLELPMLFWQHLHAPYLILVGCVSGLLETNSIARCLPLG
jgi:hypothetical protein